MHLVWSAASANDVNGARANGRDWQGALPLRFVTPKEHLQLNLVRRPFVDDLAILWRYSVVGYDTAEQLHEPLAEVHYSILVISQTLMY